MPGRRSSPAAARVRRIVRAMPDASAAQIAAAAGCHPSTVRRHLVDIGRPPPLTAKARSEQAALPGGWLIPAVVSDHRRAVRSRLAGNPGCPLPMLLRLSRDPRRNVRYNAARNCRTRLAVLGRLARDPDWWTRTGAARNPNCSPSLVEHLSRDRIVMVRAAAAAHPNCPTGALDRLADDIAAEARSNTAGNPNTSHEALQRIARRGGWKERARVAGNPNCPPPTLDRLAGDPHQTVREAAAAALGVSVAGRSACGPAAGPVLR